MLRYGPTSIILTQRTQRTQRTKNDDLRFSNTMKWDQEIWNIHVNTILNQTILDQLQLPPPPRNDSLTTSKEIHDLLIKKSARNASNQKDIENEIDTFHYLTRFSNDVQEIKELNNFIIFSNAYIIYFKKFFDRVRPRVLEPQIEPTIKPPGHPAYPSGHATKAYAFALLMSKKYPHRKDEFMRIANTIATNRELAGVHYASDTLAGLKLALQLVPIYLKIKQKK